MKLDTRSRRTRALTAVAAAMILALSAGTADARAGKGGSGFGSRGGRTYDAPATTQTAPNTAAPIERSMTSPTQPGFNQGSPRPATAQPASGGFFSRGGFMGAIMGGLLGAGIAGLLFGGGFFSGLGSLAGILGFALQALLIVFLVRLAFRFFQNRANKPAYAGAQNQQNHERSAQPSASPRVYDIPGASGGAGDRAGAASRGPQAPHDGIGIGQADFTDFERVLEAVQTAYGREDLAALRQVATPEVVSYLSEELEQNASRGVVNKVSDIRLLQGDLAEAWREGDTEYATVAMRFSLIDRTVDRATSRVVEGDDEQPVETTEVWTFTRSRGGQWLVSAIQRA
ncbi:MAG TPA: Tim44 domain-containing protein [Azospirillaceae bacterium]|nr:Tim44 domain-containing protein [Azospirillaceae bacterium]